MPKRVEPRNRIVQISVGLEQRQLEFLNKNRGINAQRLIRNAIDEQIKLEGDTEYL
jgi:hypothetical protein